MLDSARVGMSTSGSLARWAMLTTASASFSIFGAVGALDDFFFDFLVCFIGLLAIHSLLQFSILAVIVENLQV
jgi:hypothetical protein